MKDQDDFVHDIERQARELEEFMGNEMLDIIEVEGLNHFEESFDNEGFTDEVLEKWEPRKTTDTRGRDITRYRTNRVGKAGELNRYGRKNQGRKILTGHDSGGDKLKNSLRGDKIPGGVEFASDKEYAEVHNEGSDIMPKRQFMGSSKQLDENILKKVDRELDNIFDRK
ncbi:hypothetical protein BFP77_08285 [Maribacter sp. 4U21]|uniref:phage morphogenesis protein n=1 Tax=Maribacter sp. 4U21 TaxID=1889779 RepID=UPI000C5AEAE3|nr:phage morphogenesis protein [Maribacter sp. 4U21]PIB28905.1 hypothetical protein BFP77_08285 [Maribacter sp. 4U21]